MIKLKISAERGTSEAGVVFLHTARKYRFECMRGVFGSHSVPKFSLFCCHRPLPELSHLSCVFWIVSAFESVIDSVYMVSIHIFLRAIFL